MMKRMCLIVLLLFAVYFPNLILAESIFVDVNSPNDPGSGVAGDPFRKIQDAIDDANDGDTVEINPGIYTGQGNRDLDPNGTAVTIRSTAPEDPNIVANTIIDPNKAGRTFHFVSGEDANCVVSGLTIRNSRAVDDSGGAILCYNSNPTISNCVITNNTADWYGGAMFCYTSSPDITGCTISNNSAIDGGALECWSGTPILQNCIISNNAVSGNGGGIDCYNQGNVQLNNCTVAGNTAGVGGGLHCIDNTQAMVKNNVFWLNAAADGNQIAILASPFNTSELTVSYSDIQGGESGIYTDPCDPCSILIWDSGNIDTDPCFAAFELEGDPNFWDLHLQSAYGRWDVNSQTWVNDVNTSSCIDTGDPNSYWSLELWPNGKRINMGALGGTNEASMYGNIADFDVDGVVDCNDLSEITTRWLTEQDCIMDLKSDGRIDFADFSIFADNWLWQKQ